MVKRDASPPAETAETAETAASDNTTKPAEIFEGELLTTAHGEAHCLIFGDLFRQDDGTCWKITVREGVTVADIDGMLAVLSELPVLADKYGLTLESPYRTQASAQPAGEKTAQSASHTPQTSGYAPGSGANDNPLHVGRIVITGTLESPRVEMHSVNTGLQWPVIKAPAAHVAAMLTDKYQLTDLTALTVVGSDMTVDWWIDWVASPKNPKWKDLVGMRVPKFEAEG